jgi:hypothetical protein
VSRRNQYSASIGSSSADNWASVNNCAASDRPLDPLPNRQGAANANFAAPPSKSNHLATIRKLAQIVGVQFGVQFSGQLGHSTSTLAQQAANLRQSSGGLRSKPALQSIRQQAGQEPPIAEGTLTSAERSLVRSRGICNRCRTT